MRQQYSPVHLINHDILRRFPSVQQCYRSVDTITKIDLIANLPAEFPNSQHSPMPPHELILKIGCPVIPLRNLNAPYLYNGTQLVVKQLMDLVTEAAIITEPELNDTVFIPKIPFTPSDLVFPWLSTKLKSNLLKLLVLIFERNAFRMPFAGR